MTQPATTPPGSLVGSKTVVRSTVPHGEIGPDAPTSASGPARSAQAGSRVAPSLSRGLLILVVYAVIAQAGEVLSGFDSAELKASAANALTGLVLPVGLGIFAVLLIGGRGGWRDVFIERPRCGYLGRGLLWLALSLFAMAVVIGLATAPWSAADSCWSGHAPATPSSAPSCAPAAAHQRPAPHPDPRARPHRRRQHRSNTTRVTGRHVRNVSGPEGQTLRETFPLREGRPSSPMSL